MELVLFSGGAAQAVATGLQGAFEAGQGCKLSATFGAVGLMRDKLLAGEPCDAVIERYDGNRLGAKQLAQPYLSPPVTPNLADDTRWHRELIALVIRDSEPPLHITVSALECDQRSRVEGRDYSHPNSSL